jgi:hypothetical protein
VAREVMRAYVELSGSTANASPMTRPVQYVLTAPYVKNTAANRAPESLTVAGIDIGVAMYNHVFNAIVRDVARGRFAVISALVGSLSRAPLESSSSRTPSARAVRCR